MIVKIGYKTGWLGTFRRLVDVQIERLKVERRQELRLEEIVMQGQQLTDAVAKLTEAVNHAVAKAQAHTPDTIIIPVVQQISALAEQLKTTFPQA